MKILNNIKEAQMKKLGIYVHIPFCMRKCYYCDFYSVKWDKQSEENYVKAVIREIEGYKQLGSEYIADTIYFGGGTPTVINPSNIRKIIQAIKDIFTVDAAAEISIEANPNTLTSENLTTYKASGINRLSIGVQSLNDDILKSIGRLHDSRQALEAINLARTMGFENINADVMFNIPNQTVKDVIYTLTQLAEKKVKHISFYSLKLEKGTPMYQMEKNHTIAMLEDEEEREMYYAGREEMKKYKLLQYEISNFAEKGYECKHNLKYWQQNEYIGIGTAAHSFLNRKRYSNISDIDTYCKNADSGGFNRTTLEVLDSSALMFEYIMLNLRLTKGLDVKEFNQRFLTDFNNYYKKEIDYLIQNKLLAYENSSVKLTEKGMDISNYVFQRFLPK